jgi:hypothetical protein
MGYKKQGGKVIDYFYLMRSKWFGVGHFGFKNFGEAEPHRGGISVELPNNR